MLCFSVVFGLLLMLNIIAANSNTIHRFTNTKNKVSASSSPAAVQMPATLPLASIPPSAGQWQSKQLTQHQQPSTFIKINETTSHDYQSDGGFGGNRRINDDDDNYVLEDMDLIQNDQPHRRQYTYGNLRKQLQDRRDSPQYIPPSAAHRDDNMQYTKEVHIRQGALKGIVRAMHSQSGLKSVDQYLGIPYAAPPTGNGRFMPPGKYLSAFYWFTLLCLKISLHCCIPLFKNP